MLGNFFHIVDTYGLILNSGRILMSTLQWNCEFAIVILRRPIAGTRPEFYCEYFETAKEYST